MGEGAAQKRGNQKQRKYKKKGKNKSFSMMNFNAQSIKLKMEEFREMMHQEKPHIIGVTESWGQE